MGGASFFSYQKTRKEIAMDNSFWVQAKEMVVAISYGIGRVLLMLSPLYIFAYLNDPDRANYGLHKFLGFFLLFMGVKSVDYTVKWGPSDTAKDIVVKRFPFWTSEREIQKYAKIAAASVAARYGFSVSEVSCNWKYQWFA